MKMNYPRKGDKKFGKFLLIAVLLFLLIFILFFSPLKTERFLGGFVHQVGYPIWKFKTFLSDKSYFITALWRSRLYMAERNRLLQREIDSIKLSLKNKLLLEEEIRELKSLLGREDLERVIPAAVLSGPPQTSYDIFIIDGGKNLNLRGGEMVFFESVVLGKVEEVFNRTSKVKAFSSSGLEIHAFIERSNLPMVLKGRGFGNFEATLPQEADIEVGDFVVVPGIADRFIGQVEEIISIPTSSFKRVLLRYPVNLSALRWVNVEIH